MNWIESGKSSQEVILKTPENELFIDPYQIVQNNELSTAINFFISQGVFPQALKYSCMKVTPVPNTFKPSSSQDYRPTIISIFSIMSNVFEAIMKKTYG